MFVYTGRGWGGRRPGSGDVGRKYVTKLPNRTVHFSLAEAASPEFSSRASDNFPGTWITQKILIF